MATLAAQGDIAGVKGYSIRPTWDVTKYAAIDLGAVQAAIPLLMQDAAPKSSGVLL
jgi:hypothetical protein